MFVLGNILISEQLLLWFDKGDPHFDVLGVLAHILLKLLVLPHNPLLLFVTIAVVLRYIEDARNILWLSFIGEYTFANFLISSEIVISMLAYLILVLVIDIFLIYFRVDLLRYRLHFTLFDIQSYYFRESFVVTFVPFGSIVSFDITIKQPIR